MHRILRRRPIAPLIARPGVDSSAKLGRHRWIVERSVAWMARLRRRAVRYDRRADLHLAFITLAAALICLNHINWFRWAPSDQKSSRLLIGQRMKSDSARA